MSDTKTREHELKNAITYGAFQWAGSLIHDGKSGWQQLHEAQRQSYLYRAMQMADAAYGEGNWRVLRARETDPVQPFGLDGPIEGDDPVSLYVIVIKRIEDDA